MRCCKYSPTTRQCWRIECTDLSQTPGTHNVFLVFVTGHEWVKKIKAVRTAAHICICSILLEHVSMNRNIAPQSAPNLSPNLFLSLFLSSGGWLQGQTSGCKLPCLLRALWHLGQRGPRETDTEHFQGHSSFKSRVWYNPRMTHSVKKTGILANNNHNTQENVDAKRNWPMSSAPEPLYLDYLIPNLVI